MSLAPPPLGRAPVASRPLTTLVDQEPSTAMALSMVPPRLGRWTCPPSGIRITPGDKELSAMVMKVRWRGPRAMPRSPGRAWSSVVTSVAEQGQVRAVVVESLYR